MSQTVLVEVREGVASLVLNRPAALNALSIEMMQALALAVARVAADATVQVVVVRGAGEHFMAGGDIKDFDARLSLQPDARLPMFREMIRQYINPTVQTLRTMHQPVIGAVRGACAGFGFSLMSSCDLVLASDDAYFTTAYAHIALSPDGGGTYFLPRIVGTRRAAELMLLAERLGAQQALELGLVNRVVPSADLDAQVEALVQRFKAGPRHAYGEIKRLLASSGESSLADQLAAEAEAFARCSATQDFAEGIRAFLEKRKPAFRGK